MRTFDRKLFHFIRVIENGVENTSNAVFIDFVNSGAYWWGIRKVYIYVVFILLN